MAWRFYSEWSNWFDILDNYILFWIIYQISVIQMIDFILMLIKSSITYHMKTPNSTLGMIQQNDNAKICLQFSEFIVSANAFQAT